MNFEQLLIECSNNKQVIDAENLLKSIGYKPYASHEVDTNLFIHVYSDGAYQRLSYGDLHDGEELSFKQFMQKYGSNAMIEKINQEKKQLNFNNKQLSEALGYSRQYITKMLNIPQSEKIQDKVSKEIDALLNCKNNTVSELQKENEALKLSNSKLIDQLNRAEKLHIEDEKLNAAISKSINEKNSQISEQQEEILVLNKQIEDANAAIDILDNQVEESQNSIDILNEALSNAGDKIDKLRESLTEYKDKIVCERWLFLIIIAILFAVVIFK